jgi:pimeloyl-ACP methyl ester carboxylesterase
VLLHAGIADRRMWDRQLGRLADEGFTVLAVDMPGYGEAPPAAEQAPWRDVLETMDAVGFERASLVGNSFGGAIALRVAALAPDRVRALVLVSAPWEGLEPSPQLEEAWRLEEEAIEAGDIDAAVAAVVDAWTQPGADPQLRERLSLMQRQALELQLAADEPAGAVDPLTEREDALAGLGAPVLVVVGEADMPDFHEAARAAVETLPNARATTLEGAGHLAPLETPEAFDQLLVDFLREAP